MKGIVLYFQFNFSVKIMVIVSEENIGARARQNQQDSICTRDDSDQPINPHSLIRVFVWFLMGNQGPKVSLCRQKRLTRLHRCRSAHRSFKRIFNKWKSQKCLFILVGGWGVKIL